MSLQPAYHIIRLEEVASTNDYARDLLRDALPAEGTIILAGFQKKGRGHDGNTWESEAGKNLLMSIILYPDFLEVAKQFYLSMAVALGIVDALEELLPDESFLLKWPNDIYFGNRKLGGILINTEIIGEQFRYVIAGTGINVNQVQFSPEIPNPVSLLQICSKKFGIEHVSKLVAAGIMRRIGSLESSAGSVREDYQKCMLGMGQQRNFIYKGKNISATIGGVDEFGHLILFVHDQTITCDLKEVEFVF